MRNVRALHIGTSGFASPQQRPSLHATSSATADLLTGYAGLFDAVELDSVFARSPCATTVAGWCDATPSSFRFSVRMPRDVTHKDRLTMPARVSGFVDGLAPLGPRLACLLFTMPARMPCDPQLLRMVLRSVPPRVRTAWEFRHDSWVCPEVLDVLAEHGAAPAIVDSSGGPSGESLLPGGGVTDGWDFGFTYVRFRRDGYRPGDLMAWGRLLAEALGRGDVLAFFKQSPEATAYAAALSELLCDALTPVPAPVVMPVPIATP